MTIKHVGMSVLAAVMLAGSGAASAELASLKTKSGGISAPQTGTGQVVFFRPGSLMGAALGCTVREGQGQLARLGSGKYFVVSAQPGRHEYFTTGEATDKLAMEIEEGETYFVRCNIGMGVVAGRANLSPSDEASFAKKAKGLKLWDGPKAE